MGVVRYVTAWAVVVFLFRFLRDLVVCFREGYRQRRREEEIYQRLVEEELARVPVTVATVDMDDILDPEWMSKGRRVA